MTEFQISADSAEHLLKMISLTDKLEKEADGTLLYFATNELTICLHGVNSNVSYKVPISNVTIDPEYINQAYACINVPKFKAALTKCTNSANPITIRVNHEKKSLTISSASTSIAVSCYDTITEIESNSIYNYWTEKMADATFVSSLAIEITPEILEVADLATKVITGDDNNNIIVLKDNQIIYVDRVALFYKTLSNLNNTGTYYLPKSIIDFIKPLIKETKTGITIHYSLDNRHIYFDLPAYSLQVIIDVADLACDLPSNEDYANIIPEDDNHILLKVSKAALKEALSKFDGIFDVSDYRWKQMSWTISEDSLNKGVIQLHHDDFSAEVDTTLDVTVIANTASSSDFSFIIPGVILDNLVSLTDEDELTLNISPVPSNEWHGRGIEISTPTFKAVCTRFVD